MSVDGIHAKTGQSQFFDSLIEFNKKVQDEIYRGRSEYEETIKHFQEEIKRKTDLEQQLIEAKNESERTDIDIKALEKKNKELETEINKLKKEKERDIKALEKKNKDQETDINKLKKEKEREVNKLQKEYLELKSASNNLNKEKATLQLQIKEKDKALNAKTEENKNFVASAKCMEEEYQSRERNFNKTIKNLSDGKNKAEALVYEKQRVIEQIQTALNNHVGTINNQISTINSLERDKNDLTLRPSELVEANLTNKNPNIIDRSDEGNKVAEEFSKLCDTNSTIDDLSNENRPTRLAEQFSELYEIEWVDAFEVVDIGNERDKTQFMLNILKRASNLCHDTSRDHMTAIKDSFTLLNVRNAQEGTDVSAQPVTAIKTVKTPVYTKLMADFEQLANQQKNTIVEIRTVFQHQLSEQFYKIGTDMIVKEFKIEKQEDVVNYVRKCMTICWSMYRHEPPVYLDFPEIEGDQPYDENKFKYYKKTGKHLDFIVWPALYLHENGPMMAKGVAEGRN